MSISSETRQTTPLLGTGANTQIPFAFKVFQASDLLVVAKDLDGEEQVLALTTDYTVSLNANQDTSPGGTITTVAPMVLNWTYTATSKVPDFQTMTLTNLGRFFPRVLNDMADRCVILVQQVKNSVNRSLKFPLSDGTSVTTTYPTADLRANKVSAFDADGNVIVSNKTLAEIEAPQVGAEAAQAAAEAARDAALVAETNAETAETNAEAARDAALAAQAGAEAAASGMKWRPSVRAATTANITLSAPQTIDGVSVIAGDRVLVKDQSTQANNGVYIVAAGAWTRATDADTWNELVGQVVAVEEGTLNADSTWICTVNQGGTLGVTAVTWTNFKAIALTDNVTIENGTGGVAQLKTGGTPFTALASSALASLADWAAGTASKLLTAANFPAAFTAQSQRVLLETLTASNSANLSTSNFPAGYKSIELEIINLVPATDGAGLFLLTSSNNGSSYDAGASDYKYRIDQGTTAADTWATLRATGSSIMLANQVGNAAGEGFSGRVICFNPFDTTGAFKHFKTEAVWSNNATDLANATGAGWRAISTAITNLRVAFGAGNITSGQVKVWGVK